MTFRILLLVVWLAPLWGPSVSGQEQERRGPAKVEPVRGRELALRYCATCHLFPEPASLTKTAWAHHLQPEMARWLGLERPDYEGMADGKLIEEAAIFPPSPLLAEEEWFALWDYYRGAAPSQPRPQPAKPAVTLGLKQFRARKISPAPGAPLISLVRIDAPRKQILAGDAFAGVLFRMDAMGQVASRQRLGSAPVSLRPGAEGDYVTLIGRIFPSDAREGSVAVLAREDARPRPLLQALRRPTDCVPADLNGDGREDLVVCSFGNKLGSFGWFERRPDGRFEEHVLLDRPGAVRAHVRDFNRDGRPDLVVLMAQAREGILLFFNEGGGKFRLETLVGQPPGWGFAGLEIADFNQDGHPDLLACNGDNGDFALPLKAHHGVRVYLNDGTNHFTESFTYPMHGAYQAKARDFDGDGDLDIVAIAYYPDFAAERPESFVYLENQGGLKFTPSTLAESQAGRWLVLDAGDADGDGDEDVVLGSFVRGPTTVPVPAALREKWRAAGAALLLLENVARP